MNRKLVVIGSSNTDMVIQSLKLPLPGETVLGGDFIINPRDKDANEAIVATRLGGLLKARIGIDLFGEEALRVFEEAGINADFNQCDPQRPSGDTYYGR